MEDVQDMIPSIQATLAATGFTEVTLSTDSDGALLVEGTVANGEAEQMVIDLVMSSGIEDVDFFLAWSDQEEWDDDEEEDGEGEAWDDSDDDDEAEKTYTVKRGDSYWKIAVKFYGKGKGKHYPLIQAANDGKKVIHPGDVLTIPTLEA